jgi:predicted component of type VI protein secretion system
VLTKTTTGSWLLADLGSTNGTYLNDATDPLAAGQMTTLSSGDRIHVGAWTTITVHAPTG